MLKEVKVLRVEAPGSCNMPHPRSASYADGDRVYIASASRKLIILHLFPEDEVPVSSVNE